MLSKFFTLSFLAIFAYGSALAQNALNTSEDSLTNNLSKSSTTIGGYGNAFYQHNSNQQNSKVNL